MPSTIVVTIAGVDRTQVLPFKEAADDNTSQIRLENTAPGTCTAHMRLWDQTNSITLGENDSVVITDSSTPGHNLFNGYVSRRKLEIFATYRIWDIDCVDLNSWLDLKIVGAPTGSNFLQDPPGTYTAIDPNAISQNSDAATVQWLFSHYAADLPIDTTTFVETNAPSLKSQVIRWSTVTLRQALDELAAMVNSALRYWIDADWAFHWTLRPTPGVGGAGPLGRLFPVGPNIPTAPRQLIDTDPNHTTTWNFDSFSVEYDDTQWADSIYVVGSTGYTYDPVHKFLLIGGSGWVTPPPGLPPGPTGRQRILTANNSDSIAVRDSVGKAALITDSRAVVRGACSITCDFGGWEPGQAVGLTSSIAGFSNTQYMIQKVTTEFISGRGDRIVALEWGDAPVGTIGLRRQAQAGAPHRNRPRRPSARLVLTVSNSKPGAGGVVRIFAQVTDGSGLPWPVANGVTTWSVQVFNATCVNVTNSTNWTLSSNLTLTNEFGVAWTDLTTDPSANDVTYYVSASCVI